MTREKKHFLSDSKLPLNIMFLKPAPQSDSNSTIYFEPTAETSGDGEQ
jgi:hypothetical protein